MSLAQHRGFFRNFCAHPDLHSPLTKNSPASNFWGVDANFRYGDSATLMASTGSGIIDSGTALIYLSLGKILLS